MDSIIKWLETLFSRYKCLVSTTFGSDEYFRISGKLRAGGVPFRTRTYNNSYHSHQFFGRIDNTQYDIYVKYEDEHRAQQAIHER